MLSIGKFYLPFGSGGFCEHYYLWAVITETRQRTGQGLKRYGLKTLAHHWTTLIERMSNGTRRD